MPSNFTVSLERLINASTVAGRLITVPKTFD